jgi:hypothetical protein
MDFEKFAKSIQSSQPPAELNNYLLALWWDAKGDWEQAHTIIQDIEDRQAAWIHAYLHRKEGDKSNAGYWYRRAEKEFPQVTLDREWEIIAKSLLG